MEVGMIGHEFPNHTGNHLDIEPEVISEMARGVIARALKDLQMTDNYGRMKDSSPSNDINNQTQMIAIGEEVREWFRDTESMYVFSLRMCCELGKMDINKVLAVAKKWMVPRNEHYKKCLEARKDVMSLLMQAGPGGVRHAKLMDHSRKVWKYPAYATRKAVESLLKDNVVERIAHAIGPRNKATRRPFERVRWSLRKEYFDATAGSGTVQDEQVD